MTAPRHHGTPATLPPGRWCGALTARDGRLCNDIAYRCAGCGGFRFLFCHDVADDGTVVPDVRCDECGTTQTLTLGQWDDDPC